MKKKIILFTVVLGIFAMFVCTEMMAQPPTECQSLVPGISVTWEGMTKLGNGYWLARYSFSGNKVGSLTSFDIALPRNVKVKDAQGIHYADPGEGAPADIKWGQYFYGHRILTCTPAPDPQGNFVCQFEVTAGGETIGGINVNATKSGSGACDIAVPSGFAQEAVIGYKEVITEDGKTICLEADPQTQCEVAVNCDTGVPLPSVDVQQAFQIGDNPVLYVAVPGEPCQTFIADDGVPGATTYYCSGGRCYPID